MHAEGNPIADRLNLGDPRELAPGIPATVRTGRLGNIQLSVCMNGIDPIHRIDRIGTESATLTTWLLIEKTQPQLLINAGTCGGFLARGAQIGDAYLGAGTFLYHDHRVPLSGFKEFGEARIPAEPFPAVAELLQIDQGVISSGCSIDATESERAFFDQELVVAKDMEATAIASVARDQAVPFLAIKAVTDLVDHPEPSHEAFMRNLASTTESLTDHLEKLIRFIGDGVTLKQLQE